MAYVYATKDRNPVASLLVLQMYELLSRSKPLSS